MILRLKDFRESDGCSCSGLVYNESHTNKVKKRLKKEHLTGSIAVQTLSQVI